VKKDRMGGMYDGSSRGAGVVKEGGNNDLGGVNRGTVVGCIGGAGGRDLWLDGSVYGGVGGVTIFGGAVGTEILVNGGGTVVGEPEEGKYFDEMLRFVVVTPP